MDTTADVRRDIDVTRERMAATVDELEARIHDKVDAVKDKLNVADVVRAHPWPALAVAAAAGAAFASGPDRKAAEATVRAAKQSPRVVKKGLKATASGASHLAGSAVSRLKGGDEDGSSEGSGEPGFLGRAKAKMTEIARREAHVLGQHLGRAADELVSASAPRRGAAGAGRPDGAAGTSGVSATSGTMGALTPTDRY